MKQPYYILKFSGYACMFEIRVNDIIVMTLNLDGQAATNIPINYAISKSGTQEITVKVLPSYGDNKFRQGAEFKYDILLYDVTNGFNFLEEFSGYKTPEIDDNTIIPAFINKKTFEAKIPYNLKTLWTEGENISDIEDLTIKLRNAYEKIGTLVLNKNYEAFKKEIADREFNIATSMYLNQKEAKARLNGLIFDLENGFNEVELDKAAIVITSAYDKKATLKTLQGLPALNFLNPETKEEIKLDIEFYFNKTTNQFEVI